MLPIQDIGVRSWLHYQYLLFMAMPIMNYLAIISNDDGAVLPVIISTWLLLKYWRQVKDQQIVIGFLLFAVIMGLITQYWGVLGLHLFTGGFVIWPVLVLLLGDRLPWQITYSLAFIGTLIPDLYGAGVAAGWHQGWYFGVGGAGFQDALFLIPLETMIAAAVLNKFGKLMRKRGYFGSDDYKEETDGEQP